MQPHLARISSNVSSCLNGLSNYCNNNLERTVNTDCNKRLWDAVHINYSHVYCSNLNCAILECCCLKINTSFSSCFFECNVFSISQVKLSQDRVASAKNTIDSENTSSIKVRLCGLIRVSETSKFQTLNSTHFVITVTLWCLQEV